MNYTLFYHPKVGKEDIPALSITARHRIKKAIEGRLLSQPEKYGKPLRYTLKNLWSLRVGDYRVIYKINAPKIWILKIGHRKEVYEHIAGRFSLS